MSQQQRTGLARFLPQRHVAAGRVDDSSKQPQGDPSPAPQIIHHHLGQQVQGQGQGQPVLPVGLPKAILPSRFNAEGLRREVLKSIRNFPGPIPSSRPVPCILPKPFTDSNPASKLLWGSPTMPEEMRRGANKWFMEDYDITETLHEASSGLL